MPSSGGATSPTSADAAVVNEHNAKDSTRTTFIPDDYLGNLRSRLSNVPPPKPATNPLQFVKARPCALYRSAQEQLKRSEQVKQAKEVVREDAEDWQSNLDNWKSSRRKRVEHIIDRVVEAKKLEQEEHNRNRRRSKTFSEMLEERGTRRKPSLAFYAEEEDGTEFSDTTESGDNAHQASASSADESGAFHGSDNNDKRELDNDNMTYPTAVEKVNGNSHFRTSSEDSSTTSVPDCELNPDTGADLTEYTYEGAINDYKSRVINWESRNGNKKKTMPKTPDTMRYASSNDDHNSLPKLGVLKRSEIFEKRETIPVEALNTKIVPQELAQSQSIKERLSLLENRNRNEDTNEIQKSPRPKSSGDMSTVRERLSDLERRASQDSTKIQNELASCYMSKCEGVNITSADLPLVRNASCNDNTRRGVDQSAEFNDTDREDSGIHTADVSCSVSQADEPIELEEPLVNSNQELISGSVQDGLEGEEDQEDSKDDSVSQAIDIALEVFDRQNSTDNDMETTSGTIVNMVERTHIAEVHPSLLPKSLIIESETRVNNKEEKQHVNTPIVTGEVMKFPPPLYQNVQIFCDLPEGDDVEIAVTDGSSFPLLAPIKNAEPPKEKPPPPPVEDSTDDEAQEPMRKHLQAAKESAPVKRVNSTRRIRDELRTKRSSFLGIDGDESFMLSSSTIVPQQPPDMTAFLRRERQLEQQMYRQSLYYDSDNSPLGDQSESRDSGVELDRTQSDPSPWSPVDQGPPILLDEVNMPLSHSDNTCENTIVLHNNTNGDEVARREREIIELLERDEQKRQQRAQGYQTDGETLAIKLRQLEQEKLMLERERARGIEEERMRNLEERIREQQGLEATDKELSFDEDQSEEVLRVERELLQLEQEELRRQRDSLQQRREWVPPPPQPHAAALRHYASAHDISHNSAAVQQMQPKRRPPVPPAKPLKVMEPDLNFRGRRMASSEGLDTLHQTQCAPQSQPNSAIGQQMSRNTLHALSCTPRSRHIDSWVMQKRRSEPPTMNYNQHWLIQEAEQRRIEQQRGLKPNNQAWLQQHQQTRPEKHLPNSVIQTLTQRLQNRSNVNSDKVKRRFETNNIRDVPPHTQLVTDSQEKMLSVSGKKKCSHCGDELGRGAAMIIESLQLFYHIDCFKCCVCRVQLGDGLMGTDVRVRNHKLHCHNCYSSDDGIKFSCV